MQIRREYTGGGRCGTVLQTETVQKIVSMRWRCKGGEVGGWRPANVKQGVNIMSSYMTTEPRATPMPTPLSPPISHIVVRVVLPHFTELPENSQNQKEPYF